VRRTSNDVAEDRTAGMCRIANDAVTDFEMRRQQHELAAVLEGLVVGYEWHAAMTALVACVAERLKEQERSLEHGVEWLTVAREEQLTDDAEIVE
jgi:hypothetical protein